VIILAIIGEGEGLNSTLAWIYVSLRVFHSLVQSLINKIELRFVLFILSSIALIALIIQALKVLL
jgi:hypothetical protein